MIEIESEFLTKFVSIVYLYIGFSDQLFNQKTKYDSNFKAFWPPILMDPSPLFWPQARVAVELSFLHVFVVPRPIWWYLKNEYKMVNHDEMQEEVSTCTINGY